jgi:hypothetical protein
MGMTSVFETTLREQVAAVRRKLVVAQQAELEYEAHLHAARIQDLLDLGARHGIDTSAWVDPAQLGSASLAH